jgi:hypothetical protein
MTNYQPIAAQLGRVRRAWKRTAALAGLAVTVLETAGMFTVALLVDLLFRPGMQGRLVLLGVVLVAVGALLARHVLRPIFRRIPDDQVALHIEENNPGFDGALIAAAEFGRQKDGTNNAEIVEAILASAESRAGRLDVRHVTRLLRLRKYAWLAFAVVLTYGGISALFPSTVGHHAMRVVAPWRTVDKPPAPANAAPVEPPAISFALSATNANVLRGAAFRLETALSRDPNGPVQIHFRSFAAPAAEGRWYAAPMKSIEKVHAYENILPDVNEDMECYVSAERYRSESCRIRVYDPLTVEAVETVVHYPDYLALPDRVSRQANGDLAAPVGATGTVRILANRPLVAGSLTWNDGTTQPLVPGTDVGTNDFTAAASFAVTTNRTFRFRVEDSMGQVFDSPAEAYVKALADLPPAVALKRPAMPPDSVTPLSELRIEATVSDDFGVAGAELVYHCSGETDGPEQRTPISLATNAAAPGAELPATLRFRISSALPALHGGDVLVWHVEVRDRKKQTAVTDLMLTPVRHLDIWPTEFFVPSEEHMAEEEPPSLLAILQSAFRLAAQRDGLSPLDFERQVDDLALTMVNATTKAVWVFVKPKPNTPPDQIKKMDRINALAAEGHKALVAHQIAPAVDSLRRAVTLMIAMGLIEDPAIERIPPSSSAVQPEAMAQTQQQLEAMAALERQAVQEAQNVPKEKQLERADKTEELQKKLAELAAEQKKNAEAAKEIEKKDAEAAAKAAPPPDQTGARKQAAEDQKNLAEKVKDTADKVEQDRELDQAQAKKSAEAMRDAARQMDQAAHEMQQGRVEKAAQAADAAFRTLEAAGNRLDTAAQDKLAQALAQAEKQASQALRKQNDIAKNTEEAAPKPTTPVEQQKMQSLAARQARVKADLDALQQAVSTLKQAVEAGAVKPETAKHIQDAEREMRRGRPAQKAANAAVALTAQNREEALAAQKQAAESLTKAQASLRQASDSTATGFEAELDRARHEAEQAEQQLQELHDTPAAAPQAQDRQAKAEDALDTAAKLARHVQARDFVAPQTTQELREQVEKTAASGANRIENDKEKAMALMAAVQKVRTELDAAHEKLQENKRLFSSQREECPPQYRPLVNKYFESLSDR